MILCLGLILFCSGFSSQFKAKGENVRLTRILLGNNDRARYEQLRSLREDIGKRIEVMDDLINVANILAKRAEEKPQYSLVIGELFQVLGMIDRPKAKQALITLLDSRRMEVAMSAANALGQNRILDAIEPLKKQIDRPEYDEHYGFRFNLVRSLLQMNDADTFQFLRKLADGLDGQLRHELTKALKDVPEQSIKSPEEKKVADGKDELANVLSEASYSESMDRVKFGKSQYYDIPIHAKRLLFVLDCSGSMQDFSISGTRLANAKRELTVAIEGLVEDSEFGILIFSEGIHPYREYLTVASKANKEAAINFVRGLKARSSTNTYGALRASIDFDDQLETVFILTDGQPTCGKIVSPRMILDDIIARNSIRNLTINTIGIGVSRSTEAFLETLAERSNGVYRRPK